MFSEDISQARPIDMCIEGLCCIGNDHKGFCEAIIVDAQRTAYRSVFGTPLEFLVWSFLSHLRYAGFFCSEHIPGSGLRYFLIQVYTGEQGNIK